MTRRAATTRSASALPTCFVLVTTDTEVNRVTDVSVFGSDELDRVRELAQHRTEDGDGTYQYAIRRVHGLRATELLRLVAAARRAGTCEARQLLAKAQVGVYLSGADR